MSLIKKFINRNVSNLVILISLAIFFCYLILSDDLSFKVNSQITHVDLLTINAIFIGFLFTTLGVLVGFLNNNRIIKLDRNGYMDNYYNTIYFGLFFFIISAICGVVGIFLDFTNLELELIYIEQLSMLSGLTYFIKAIYSLARIISKVRNSL